VKAFKVLEKGQVIDCSQCVWTLSHPFCVGESNPAWKLRSLLELCSKRWTCEKGEPFEKSGNQEGKGCIPWAFSGLHQTAPSSVLRFQKFSKPSTYLGLGDSRLSQRRLSLWLRANFGNPCHSDCVPVVWGGAQKRHAK